MGRVRVWKGDGDVMRFVAWLFVLTFWFWVNGGLETEMPSIVTAWFMAAWFWAMMGDISEARGQWK